MDSKSNKIRVKCANCGMIYDLTVGTWDGNDPENMRGECPKCSSNAFDKYAGFGNILKYK